MAAKKRVTRHPLRIDEMRDKIRATLLIKRLEDHAFAAVNDPDIAIKVMTDSQVRAALGLLGKVLPNVSEIKQDTEHSGVVGFQWVK